MRACQAGGAAAQAPVRIVVVDGLAEGDMIASTDQRPPQERSKIGPMAAGL